MSQAQMWLGKNGFKFNKAVLMLSLSDFTFNIKQKIGRGNKKMKTTESSHEVHENSQSYTKKLVNKEE